MQFWYIGFKESNESVTEDLETRLKKWNDRKYISLFYFGPVIDLFHLRYTRCNRKNTFPSQASRKSEEL